jgi:hypothetical protein
MELELKIKASGTAQESDLEPILSVLELVSLGDLGNIIISDGAGHRE